MSKTEVPRITAKVPRMREDRWLVGCVQRNSVRVTDGGRVEIVDPPVISVPREVPRKLEDGRLVSEVKESKPVKRILGYWI